MKKLLLSFCLVGSTYFSLNAQVVQVLYPAEIVEAYENTFADWSNTPDMTIDSNRVVGQVKLASPRQLCTAAPAGFFTDRIALISRGGCEFGKKARNAYDAGAIGVIIADSLDGPLVNMAVDQPGLGNVVNVPVTFIKKVKGDILIQKLTANPNDSIVVLLGNKNGFYANDLGTVNGYTANVPAQVPVQMAENTTDFPIVYQAQIYNYGADTAHNVKVVAELFKGSSLLHSSTSNVISELAPKDSVESFTFDEYSGALGVGDYKIVYTLVADETDDSPGDNVFTNTFRVNNDKRFSYAQYDYDDNFTHNSGNYGPATRTGTFKSCIDFINPTDTKMGIKGVYFNASIANDDAGNEQSIEGEEIYFSVEKWSDNFTWGTQPTFDDLELVVDGSYVFSDDIQNEFIYKDFPTSEKGNKMLEKNGRYLVCATLYNDQLYIGHDSEIAYDMYIALVEKYLFPLADGATWYAAGFGIPPTLTLQLATEDELGLANQDKVVEATIYPNPAKNFINVSVSNYEGNATLIITDVAGKTVNTQEVNLVSGNANINTSNLTAGMYIVKMELADGSQIKKNIIIE